MTQYLVRRIIHGFVTIWLVTLIVFLLLRVVVPLVHADVVDIIAAEYGRSDPALAQQLREEYGLTGSVPLQYVRWLGELARGDLGESLFNGRTIVSEMRYRVPVSLELSLIGLASSVLLSVPMGAIAALKQNRWPDYAFRTYAVGASAIPNFWLAILIITFGSLWFRWAPPIQYAAIWDDPVQHFKIMLLPALLVGLTPSGGLLRVMRAQMLEVLRQDYVRTARAKGLHESAVLTRHAARNALIPVVTIVGLALPGLLAGTALYEIIFGLPGMGQYLISATQRLDYPVILGTNLVFAVLIVTANLVVDISYTFIDPRIRYSSG